MCRGGELLPRYFAGGIKDDVSNIRRMFMSTETNKIRQEYLTGERALFQAKEMEIGPALLSGIPV